MTMPLLMAAALSCESLCHGLSDQYFRLREVVGEVFLGFTAVLGHVEIFLAYCRQSSLRVVII